VTFQLRVQAEALPVTVRWKPSDGSGVVVRVARASGTGRGRLLRSGEAAEFTGGSVVTLTLTVEPVDMPRSYALEQNYPNPFNPSTEIRYALPSRSHVRLGIYNILGELVATLVDAVQDGGVHRERWTASVASGVYFYRIEARSQTEEGHTFTQVKKMMLIR
jgi:hypothetical protein